MFRAADKSFEIDYPNSQQSQFLKPEGFGSTDPAG